MTESFFDALIVGAGPAGSTAATLLAARGWKVALVERKLFPRRKVCGEYLSGTNWPLLDLLGVSEEFALLAGPPVTETAIFVGSRMTTAPLPCPGGDTGRWGRALSREVLDTLLLDRARKAGAELYQPCRCDDITNIDGGFLCRLAMSETVHLEEVKARIVIAAHGSWERGSLVTQVSPRRSSARDLFAFKAHFRQTNLPPGMMPLLSFQDGYGGMVHCDGGRTSLSCCIRRSRLDLLDRSQGGQAGDAVLEHILRNCPPLRSAIGSAVREEAWLSAGPIRPGLRPCCHHGIFVIGNAAGEAHPVVAEGISMAMQSAWLLASRLIPHQDALNNSEIRGQIAKSYQAAWRRAFVPRIRTAATVAHWAMHPALVNLTMPFLHVWPGLLTWGASLSGKERLVVNDSRTEATGKANGVRL